VAAMLPARLSVSFKGERRYVHGSDLMPELVRVTEAETAISLRLHRQMSGAVEAVSIDVADPPLNYDAVFLYRRGGRDLRAGVRALQGEPLPIRIPYNEEDATSGAVLGVSSIAGDPVGSYSCFERAIALNKILLNHLWSADGQMKWLLTRFDLDRRPDAVKPHIQLVASSATNARLIKSQLYFDHALIGAIWFSRVDQ
jgi:hypothetical protein